MCAVNAHRSRARTVFLQGVHTLPEHCGNLDAIRAQDTALDGSVQAYAKHGRFCGEEKERLDYFSVPSWKLNTVDTE